MAVYDLEFNRLFCKSAALYLEFKGNDIVDGVCMMMPLDGVVKVGSSKRLNLDGRARAEKSESMNIKAYLKNFYDGRTYNYDDEFRNGKTVFISTHSPVCVDHLMMRIHTATQKHSPKAHDANSYSESSIIPDENTTKVYALVFPQFHEDKTNNRLWGNGFTDWDSLTSAPTINMRGDVIIDPLPRPLGYYDMTEYDVRRAQGRLAKKYGVDGFIYHHYWFFDSRDNNPLSRPLENMLADGEPDIPFAFHWANSDWSRKWNGLGALQKGRTFISQQYPDPNATSIEDHYMFLKKFFDSKNYIRINGCPLFMVYRTHLKATNMVLRKLQYLAKLDGFPNPGLHITEHKNFASNPLIFADVNGSVMSSNRITKPLSGLNINQSHLEGLDDVFEAIFIYPDVQSATLTLPHYCLKGMVHNETKKPFYLSVRTTFDNTPRRNVRTAKSWRRTQFENVSVVDSFENDITISLLFDICCQNPVVREKGGKFVVVNAWNEWGEGMSLEPSNVYGYGFLEAIARAKSKVRKFGCHWHKYAPVSVWLCK
jgi:hypothetical protein